MGGLTFFYYFIFYHFFLVLSFIFFIWFYLFIWFLLEIFYGADSTIITNIPLPRWAYIGLPTILASGGSIETIGWNIGKSVTRANVPTTFTAPCDHCRTKSPCDLKYFLNGGFFTLGNIFFRRCPIISISTYGIQNQEIDHISLCVVTLCICIRICSHN